MQFRYSRLDRYHRVFCCRVLWGVLSCGGMLATVGVAVAAEGNSGLEAPAQGIGSERFGFDIAGGPLREALRRHGDITGMAVLVDDGLVAGRSASAVNGEHGAREALYLLLQGSGLVPRYTGDDAFTLERDGGHGTPGLPASAATAADVRMVGLQQAIERALCASTAARPGDYRAALQLWFEPQGEVERVHLLATTGSEVRDRAIRVAVGGMTEGGRDMHDRSPVTVLVLPRRAGAAAPCADRRR